MVSSFDKIFFSFFVLDDFSMVLQFLIGPNAPSIIYYKLQNFQSKFAIRTMAYGYSRTKKKLPVNTVSEIATTVIIMYVLLNKCIQQRNMPKTEIMNHQQPQFIL